MGTYWSKVGKRYLVVKCMQRMPGTYMFKGDKGYLVFKSLEEIVMRWSRMMNLPSNEVLHW